MTYNPWPRAAHRATKHAKPKYQLYMWGFNHLNSCWMTSGWQTVTKAEYGERAEAHAAQYAEVLSTLSTQRHNGPPTAVDQMTTAQKTGYDHCSGGATLECRRTGIGLKVGMVSIALAGGKISDESLKPFRSQPHWRAIPKILHPYTLGVTDQATLYGLPADILSDDTEPVHAYKLLVKQNKQNRFDSALYDVVALKHYPSRMACRMPAQYLVSLEMSIIRTEWEALVGRTDPFADLQWDIKAYVELRAAAAQIESNFFLEHKIARDEHNRYARQTLNTMEGKTIAFVLPKFYPDGTHEPWGERDVPWNLGV